MPDEVPVRSFETGEHAREERLDADGRCAGGYEIGQGGGGTRVDGVETDAEDDLVGAVGVAALGEDAADLDIGCLVWLRRVEAIFSLSETWLHRETELETYKCHLATSASQASSHIQVHTTELPLRRQ